MFTVLIAIGMLTGCAARKQSGRQASSAIETESIAGTCGKCHSDQVATWMESPHADQQRMNGVKNARLRQCGACHDQLAAHIENPGKVTPPSLSGIDKSGQNAVCGKCHYQKEVTDGSTVNPHNRHGLLMSVGLEGFKRQISCLDCHRGHSEKADMLKTTRAHTCFGCHKEAVITMGVFQPVNYLTLGKTCVSCHPAHGGSRPHQIVRMTAGMAVTCFVCHPTGDLHQVGF